MNFARPLLRESLATDESNCYWLAGSCFLAGLRERLFIVTARHVASNVDADELRVLAMPPDCEFLPIRSGCSAIPFDQFDPDYADLSAFEVDTPLLSPQALEAMSILRLGEHDRQGMDSAPLGSRLIVRGYPWDLNNIDYETGRIQLQALQATGSLAGCAPMQGCHTLNLDDPSAVDNLQLMSGSVIMAIPDDHQINPVPRLAGMAVRGGNGQIHFVDSARICLFLEMI
jgi:hypothetical protein